MTQEILINVGAAETRIAAVEDDRLQALACEITLDAEGAPRRRGSMVGEVRLGRVSRVVPAIQAAFVEIGMDRAGFLGLKEARILSPDQNADADAGTMPAIGDMVREGDAVQVQIIKDPIGEKGARLTAAITLPGRLLVLTPYQNAIALSHRIADETERARLMELGQFLQDGSDEGLIPGAGYIFRTNAVGAERTELEDEARALCDVWRGIQATRAAAKPPAVLYRDLGPVERALRDLVRSDTARIRIDDAAAIETAAAYCRRFLPGMESRIAPHSGAEPLFDAYDLENDIQQLAQPRVPLPCGGWITVETTEALTSVDVNSGSFTRAADIEDMSFLVNGEAAREVGRQIRLRGIGGVIVIDFIHMTDPEHNRQMLETLEKSLAYDGAPVVVAPISPFGLVEVTRKRIREPREKLQNQTCDRCHGLGRVPRPATVGLAIVRQMEAAAKAAPGAMLRVAAAPEVVSWLAAQGAPLTSALAARGAVRIAYEAVPESPRERFDVETRA